MFVLNLVLIKDAAPEKHGNKSTLTIFSIVFFFPSMLLSSSLFPIPFFYQETKQTNPLYSQVWNTFMCLAFHIISNSQLYEMEIGPFKAMGHSAWMQRVSEICLMQILEKEKLYTIISKKDSGHFEHTHRNITVRIQLHVLYSLFFLTEVVKTLLIVEIKMQRYHIKNGVQNTLLYFSFR